MHDAERALRSIPTMLARMTARVGEKKAGDAASAHDIADSTISTARCE